MRAIDIISRSTALASKVLFTFSTSTAIYTALDYRDETYPSEFIRWPKLECFRCRSAIPAELLGYAVGPAAAGGSLRVLDIQLRTESGQDLTPIPARDLPFTFSDQIHTLGLSAFSWTSFADHLGVFKAQPLFDWLDHLPNVEEVRIHPGAHANTLSMVRQLLRRNKIKSISEDCLVDMVDKYAALDEASRRGVKLVHADYAPPTWPWDNRPPSARRTA